MMINKLDLFSKYIDSDKCSELLNKKTPKNGGFYGEYYEIGNGAGIKVIREAFIDISKLHKSINWEEARRELELLEIAKCSKLTPKPLKILEVNICNYTWHSAILMEHVKGIKLRDYTKIDDTKKRIICDSLQLVLLERTNLWHRDLSDNNVIVTRDFFRRKMSFKIIDFTPKYIDMIYNKKDKEQIINHLSKQIREGY